MKTNLMIGVILALLAAGLYGHLRKAERYEAPALAAGYRGLVLEMPGNQLAWLKKGDSVDFISVFDAVMGEGRKEKVAATLLQNVRVAGVNQRNGTIVLLVNPNEAQYASLAKVQGEVRLSLRAPGDSAMSAMEISSYRRLIK